MLEVGVCPECKVPEPFYQGHVWLNNGDIVQSGNDRARMGFIECEALDPLFKNIGSIIGVSIDPIIVNVTARGSEQYMKGLIPKEIRKMVRERSLGLEPFIEPTITLCHILGYGRYEFIDHRYEQDAGDYSIMRIMHPFSVPEAAGSFAGVVSAMVGGEHDISYEELSPGLYEFTSHWTEYPEVFKEKLHIPEYHHRDGDIELDRCGTCGSPSAFSGYYWYLEKGVIVNGRTGRRMAILGHELLDAVFNSLECELGEAIPRVVVEAQRRFVKTGFYSIEEVKDENDFRTQLALRGLGNVREVKMGVGGMRMRIENVSAHLLTIGMAQGLFEMALDAESHVDWQLSQTGDLELEVITRKIRETVAA